MVPRDETHSECRIAHWRHAKKNVKMRGGGECDRAKARRSRAREGERRASCATFECTKLFFFAVIRASSFDVHVGARAFGKKRVKW